MTNSTLAINDVILQSLAFLSQDAVDGTPLTGLIIGDIQAQGYQISAIDQAIKDATKDAIDWQIFHPYAFIQQPFSKRYDLAVIILSNDEGLDTQVIQRCRDLFAKHCLVVQNLSQTIDNLDKANLDKDSLDTGSLNTSSVDMVSFGFSRLHDQPIEENQQLYQVWQFNLFDYKHLPDWFNSKFWANPELWNKFRW